MRPARRTCRCFHFHSAAGTAGRQRPPSLNRAMGTSGGFLGALTRRAPPPRRRPRAGRRAEWIPSRSRPVACDARAYVLVRSELGLDPSARGAWWLHVSTRQVDAPWCPIGWFWLYVLLYNKHRVSFMNVRQLQKYGLESGLQAITILYAVPAHQNAGVLVYGALYTSSNDLPKMEIANALCLPTNFTGANANRAQIAKSPQLMQPTAQ